MTTKHWPMRVLKHQADTIASIIKAAERGEKIEGPFAAKIEAARSLPSFKGGIVMDDKIITLEIAWATVRETSQGRGDEQEQGQEASHVGSFCRASAATIDARRFFNT